MKGNITTHLSWTPRPLIRCILLALGAGLIVAGMLFGPEVNIRWAILPADRSAISESLLAVGGILMLLVCHWGRVAYRTSLAELLASAAEAQARADRQAISARGSLLDGQYLPSATAMPRTGALDGGTADSDAIPATARAAGADTWQGDSASMSIKEGRITSKQASGGEKNEPRKYKDVHPYHSLPREKIRQNMQFGLSE